MSSDDDAYPYQVDGRIPAPPPMMDSSKSRSSTNSPVVPNKGKSRDSRPLSEDLVQEELRSVLELFRERRHIEIQKTPEVYINQDSSVSEVHDWLKAKGFSDRVVRQLTGMNGNELLGLKKPQIEEFFGKDEGRRLFSQITVSRNFTGYKTARSSELRAILARARAKAEGEGDDFNDKDQFVRKKATEENTRLNSMSNSKGSSPSPKVYSNGHKNSHDDYDDDDDNRGSLPAPPPPPPIAPVVMKQSPTANKENKNGRVAPVKQPIPKSKYDPDSESDDDSDKMDGKSTLSRMVKQRQRQMLRK